MTSGLGRAVRALPHELWVLFAATFVNRAGTMVLPFLALYLTRVKGLPPQRAGLVLSVFGASALVTSPLAGRLGDRIGPVRQMKASLFLSALALLAFPLARSLPAIAAMTAVLASVSELFRPASLAAIARLAEPSSRRTAYAVNRLGINLGMSIGPALGGLLAGTSYTALFVVDAVTSLAAAGILVLSRWADPAQPRAARGTSGPAIPSAARDPRLRSLLLATLPVAIVFFQHAGPLALHVVSGLGFSERAFGLLVSVNTVLVVLLELPVTSATSRWPARASLALGALLVGAGFGLLALGGTATVVVASVVVWTFGEIVLLPALSTAVADLAPEERRGEYMGLYLMAFNLAFAVGPWAGTALLSASGPGALWGAAFGGGLLSALVYLLLSARYDPGR